FNNLAKAMNREELLSNDKFYTNSKRLENDTEINQIVSDWIKTKKWSELQERLDMFGVPANRILSIKDMFEDPQYKAHENIIEVNHPRLGKIETPGIVPKFEKTPGSIRSIAPDLGENNFDILHKF